MNTEELYIWRYGIDKLPKGLLEYGKSDVCDIYDESKRQKFQNLGQWMWQNNDGWRENLPPVLYLVCNKKPGILQFDFLDKRSIELKIVSEEFLSLLQENGFVDKYDIATVKVVNKKNEPLTDKKYYALREGTEKVSLQLFKELNLHIACILFGYVQIFCTLMP